MEQSGTADLIRAEDGSVRYEYFISLNDPETVLLIDSWRDQEAIDTHHASPMMATLATLREKYDLHMTAERYLSDEAGISEHDRSRAGTLGGFSEYILCPNAKINHSLYPVDERILDQVACLIEPFTVGGRAAKQANPMPKDQAAVR